MSKNKLRTEKNCLNCNAIVTQRFCSICGQENIEIKESFWGIVSHFFKDITHYDGKFLSTLTLLITKPGFLSAEYLRGRRSSYLNPIRLYVFTSAFFFLVYFTFYQEDTNIIKINNSASSILTDLKRSKDRVEKALSDSNNLAQLVKNKNDLEIINADIALLEKDSTAKDKLQYVKNSFGGFLLETGSGKRYSSLANYDSVQKALPDSLKHGYLEKRLHRQSLYLDEKFQKDGRKVMDAILSDFKHRFPQMLFVSLPLLALLLKMLYIRRKNFLYVSHIIFSIHLYCAFFIFILFSLWLTSLLGLLNLSMPGWLSIIFALFCYYFLYKSLRVFYEQRRAKTIFKFLLLLFLLIILMAFLFAFFFLFSTFTIK